ncbi:MAG: helix-turn-helix transcriptional regulator [Oscillospiraceae bacterium]|nr:helix-turn-helix transcriptional regulator [Oscillospiraceae bacterium]
MNSIAKNIKELRTEKGWTQQQLADMLFVTRQAVSNWENGKTEPDADTLMKIADIMQVDVNKIIGDNTTEGNGTALSLNEKKSKIDSGVIILSAAIIVLIFFRYFYPRFNNFYFNSHSSSHGTAIHDIYSRIDYRLWIGALVSAAALETLSAVLIVRLMRLWGRIKSMKQTVAIKIIRWSLIILFSLHIVNMILPDIDFIFGLNLLNIFHQAVKPVLKILGHMRLAAFYPEKRWIFIILGCIIELLHSEKQPKSKN